MHLRRTAVLLAASLAVALAIAATASAAPTWAPAATAAIHPGVMTFTAGAQCTANFVFYNGTTVYIGQAAHCSGTGGATETDGCTPARSRSAPPSTSAAWPPARWSTTRGSRCRRNGETNADTCAYNDLALVQLDPADAAKVNPSIPFWGGPTGVGTRHPAGDNVYSYGNSSLRLGVTALSPKRGVSLGDDWRRLEPHRVHRDARASPVTRAARSWTASGKAIGVLSRSRSHPLPASNGVGDIGREARLHELATALGVTLATGTEPFRGPLLP